MNAFAVWAIFHSNEWSIKVCGMCCPVCGKVHMKDPVLLSGKSSLCGDSRLPLKKYVRMTICLTSNSRWCENQCALEASLNKTNIPFLKHKMAGPADTDAEYHIVEWILKQEKNNACNLSSWQHLRWHQDSYLLVTVNNSGDFIFCVRWWCCRPSFPVGQHYKVTMNLHCHKLVPILIWP